MKRFWNALNAPKKSRIPEPVESNAVATADARTMSPREVFGSLDDQSWYAVLTASVKEPVQNGVRLPGFAAADLQSQTVGSSGTFALAEALKFYSFVRKACDANDRPLGAETRILDFGVSWGRIIRFFLKDTDAANLHGVDVNDEYLAAARDSGCQATLQKITPLGTLPYSDESFDLVYAYSVFTHLPENDQDHWLAEIRRVTKPGGILVATVEPPRFIEFFKDVDPDDETRHPWHRQMSKKIKDDPGIKTRLDEKGFSYIRGSDTYGDTIMTSAYAQQHWGQYFEVRDFLDDPAKFWQAVVTAKRI
jgi:ubiquinone/menaquinone biosynthesis C-methylase UbiE